jgi:hypothetical protein
MRFADSYDVESLAYQMQVANWPRSRNRALVNQLFNGFRPYTDQECQDNDLSVNFNDLTSTRKAHDARGQMYSAILKPGNFFKATADIGPKHSRATHSQTVTRLVNRVMKRSMGYYELQRSKIAQAILHGIGIGAWPDQDSWRPRAMSIEDVLIPAGEPSELPMEGLPLFALHKSYTARDLIRLTREPNRDPAWNMPMVEACLKWVDEQTKNLLYNNWPTTWAAEKWEERRKEGDSYGGDTTPTIDVYDFFFWDDGEESGWKRRMILDAWGSPTMSGGAVVMTKRPGELYQNEEIKGQFLYNPGDRVYAKCKDELISFQFADLSAVAPFRYHTIRGLGFLLHDACQIQNRLTCKITESTFETLTMLMRVKSQEDVQRALKANLFNRGFVDETVQFIPQAERWQVNTNLVEFGWEKNRQLIESSSGAASQNQDMSKGVEKGQLQIMAELNATTAMLSAGMLQYYQYQYFEYKECFRRFFNRKPDCRDVEVKAFQAQCLAQGVPEEMLSNPDGWEIEPERTMGAGNKTMELAIAAQLLQMRPMYDPDAQRDILRDATLAFTDDPARAIQLVPDEPRVSDTVHDTELVYSSLMAGHPITPKTGLNAEEAASTILKMMSHTVQQIMQSGGVGTPQDVKGLTMAAGYAAHFIKVLEEDKNSKKTAVDLNTELGKLGNQIKAMQQRQQEQAKKAAAQNPQGGLPPEAQAKVAAIQATTQAKIQAGQQSHAMKTAQRQISFEEKVKQDRQKHEMELHKQVLEHGAELHKKNAEMANGKKNSLKSFDE